MLYDVVQGTRCWRVVGAADGPPGGEEVGTEIQGVRRELTRRSMCDPSAADGGGLEVPANSMRARAAEQPWSADDR